MAKLGKVFVHVKSFHPSLIFEGKAEAYLSGAPLKLDKNHGRDKQSSLFWPGISGKIR